MRTFTWAASPTGIPYSVNKGTRGSWIKGVRGYPLQLLAMEIRKEGFKIKSLHYINLEITRILKSLGKKIVIADNITLD